MLEPDGPFASLTLVDVSSGSLEQRDARSGRKRVVAVVPFAIGRTPVSVAQFASGRGEASGGDVPVHGVTWMEAVA